MSFATQRNALIELRKSMLQAPDQAVIGLQSWLQIARRTDDCGLIAEGLADLTCCYRALNRLAEAMETSGQACVLAESSANRDVLHKALMVHAMMLDDMGRPADALQHVERANALECELEARDLAATKGICGSLLCRMGRTEEGLAQLRSAVEACGAHRTERFFRRMVLIWHLVDDIGQPDTALREWNTLVEDTEWDRFDGQLRTARLATAVGVWAANARVGDLRAAYRALLEEHRHAPHVCTGWALMLALEAFVTQDLLDEASSVIQGAQELVAEMRKSDLHRWLLARRDLAGKRGQAQEALALAAEADQVRATYLTPPGDDPRILIMQLRNLEFRLSLARSHHEAERLRREIERREEELRARQALPPSLLSELVVLRGRHTTQLGEPDLGPLGFHLVFQPFLDLRTHQIKGTEALLRLNHPELGPRTPAEFIPRLDASGEIEVVGRWVLGEACRQLRKWQHSYPQQVVAVNVSAPQLATPGLSDFVAQLLEHHGVNPAGLELEITETIACSETDTVLRELERLVQLGVGISIDDFGTGYSNFGRLLDLLPSKVKIDRSLINRLGGGERPRRIVATLIQAAHSMGISVTAEGIELVQQAQVLRELGCDYLQGYLLGRPADPATLGPLLRQPAGHWIELLEPAAAGVAT